MGMHVSLTQELETLVHREVKSGMYQNVSEVIRAALRNFFAEPLHDNKQEEAWQKLEGMLSEGLDQIKNGEVTNKTCTDIANEVIAKRRKNA